MLNQWSLFCTLSLELLGCYSWPPPFQKSSIPLISMTFSDYPFISLTIPSEPLTTLFFLFTLVSQRFHPYAIHLLPGSADSPHGFHYNVYYNDTQMYLSTHQLTPSVYSALIYYWMHYHGCQSTFSNTIYSKPSSYFLTGPLNYPLGLMAQL